MKNTSILAISIMAFCVIMCLGCCPECEEINDPNIILDAIQSGSIITITNEDLVQIDGIVVGKKTFALDTGCFGIPECVAIDDTHRGVIRKLDDDFAVYDDNEEMTGTTYFLTTFYDPYWAGNASPVAFRAIVDAHSGGAYQQKRQGCCANNPDKCHCYE